MRRSSTAFLASYIVLFSFLGIGLAGPKEISVTLDGQKLSLDQPPITYHGRVMAPIRVIFEGLGATVSYDPVARTISANRDTTDILLTVGSNSALVNGTEQPLDVPPMVIGNRVLIPLRFIVEAMGAEAHWAADANTVEILSRTGGGMGLTPRIETIQHNTTDLLRSGDTVTTDLFGEPGGKAFFDITGVTTGVPMIEISPGHYLGSFVIQPGIVAPSAYVVGHLRVQERESMASDSRPLSIRAVGLDATPTIEVRPLPGTVVTVLKPHVDAFFPIDLSPGSLHFLVDGVDFTDQVRFGRKSLEWVPQNELSIGEHHVLIYGKSAAGDDFRREWNFYVNGSLGNLLREAMARSLCSAKIGENMTWRMLRLYESRFPAITKCAHRKDRSRKAA